MNEDYLKFVLPKTKDFLSHRLHRLTQIFLTKTFVAFVPLCEKIKRRVF